MSADTSVGGAKWPNYALPRGTTVNGYRIERVLGSGGFGVTYLARDLLQQPFAIKEYYPRQFAIRHELSVLTASAEDEPLFEECRQRFLREAQALVLLGRVAGAGDGIVRVQTYFEALGTCFLVMDYVEGASLASVLRQQPGGLAAGRVKSLLSQLLSAIGVVHRAGLMHRDIKPANIIMREDDRVVLIDFGSSREATSGQTTAYTQIYSGGYAPPEQMLGLRQGAFSDIYAIGAVCYQAIGGTVMDALARQIAVSAGRADPQPSAAEVGAGRYPDALLAAIDEALATDAARRPQTVEAMLETLGREAPAADAPAADATIVLARPPAPIGALLPQAQPQPQRQPWRRGLWGVVAAAGALVVAGAAYFALRGPATQPPANRQEVAASTPAPVTVPAITPSTVPPATTPSTVPPATTSSGAALPVQRQGVQPPATDDMAKHATAASGQPDAAPTVAPVPTPPMKPPQREAIVVPPSVISPPAPAPTPAPSSPDAAPTVSPAPVAPAEPPQREAILIPPYVNPPSAPVPVPAPPPTPVPTPGALSSPLERGQAAARALPCSILHVASGQDGLHVSGLAPAGQDLDRLLAELRELGRLAEDITRVDRFACGPLATMHEFAGWNSDHSPPTIAIRLDHREVPSGARLRIDIATIRPVLYLDLYHSDGSVRHLLRPVPSGKAGKPQAEWIATSPAGPHLVVALGLALPLDLGARPDTEKAADYLAALQPQLQQVVETLKLFSTADLVRSGPVADAAVVTVRSAEPAAAKASQPRPTNVQSERCANIVNRAQLGEALTDAERVALRTECRS